MNIFISHSPKDRSLAQMIAQRLAAKNFHLLVKKPGLLLFSGLTTQWKNCISLSNGCVVIFSPNGKGSYLVHQEAGFMNMISKNHFILESNGNEFQLKENLFESELPVLENEKLYDSWHTIRQILLNVIPELRTPSSPMVFHTGAVI